MEALETEDAVAGPSSPLWVIIDTNRLASDQLRDFLAASPENRAVLPDYVAMERFKMGDLDRLREGFAVLKLFANQVVVLKATGEISTLNPDVEQFPDALIDKDQTEAFTEFCSLLDRAGGGDESILSQLRERVGWAQAQMDVVLGGASDFPIGMAEFEQFFSPKDLARIRRGEPMTAEINTKFHKVVSTIVDTIFRNAPVRIDRPNEGNLPNHFILRNVLCTGVYMLSCIERGIGARRPEKARNDVIDVLLATYGTYFNGVMSNDALTNEVHVIGRCILENSGVSLAPNCIEVMERS